MKTSILLLLLAFASCSSPSGPEPISGLRVSLHDGGYGTKAGIPHSIAIYNSSFMYVEDEQATVISQLVPAEQRTYYAENYIQEWNVKTLDTSVYPIHVSYLNHELWAWASSDSTIRGSISTNGVIQNFIAHR